MNIYNMSISNKKIIKSLMVLIYVVGCLVRYESQNIFVQKKKIKSISITDFNASPFSLNDFR